MSKNKEETFNTNYDDSKLINVNSLVKKKKKDDTTKKVLNELTLKEDNQTENIKNELGIGLVDKPTLPNSKITREELLLKSHSKSNKKEEDDIIVETQIKK